MAGYTYPPTAPVITGDLVTINTFLKSPRAVASAVQDMLERRYISDVLLPGRYEVIGGSIIVEGERPVGANDPARAISPGAEYPLTTFAGATQILASTKKWGEDAEITDESITRRKLSPVTEALSFLAEQNVITIDGLTMSAVSSAVTQTRPATAPWATATGAQVIEDVVRARTTLIGLNKGIMPNLVVCDDATYANVWLALLKAGMLPREDPKTLATAPDAGFPFMSMTWLPTPNALPGTALIADTTKLGGMADEKIESPGYVSAGNGKTAPVEVKAMRVDERDLWRVRARRVTVPVVRTPSAAIKITGV